jgi:alpha-amylase/alpha-mannosidase (GH57 family)
VQSGTLTAEQIKLCEEQLAVCEGSDWFWWLGDYNSAASISSFDNLYRRNLSNLYVLLKLPVPVNLSIPINVDNSQQENEVAANSGTMKRGKES